jgi:hypothetical protein
MGVAFGYLFHLAQMQIVLELAAGEAKLGQQVRPNVVRPPKRSCSVRRPSMSIHFWRLSSWACSGTGRLDGCGERNELGRDADDVTVRILAKAAGSAWANRSP